MSDPKKCLICLEEMETNQEYLPCAHSFHGNCIIPWLQENDTCPICKIPIFIDTPGQLDTYNHNRQIQEERDTQERHFFQRLSAGELNTETPTEEPNIFAIISSVITTGSNIATHLDLHDQVSHSNNTLMSLAGLFDTLAQDGHLVYTQNAYGDDEGDEGDECED